MGLPDNQISVIRKKKVECTVVSIEDKVKITPSKPLVLNANYLVTCSAELKSSMGVNISPFNIGFSTVNPFRVVSFRQYGSDVEDTVIRITFSSDIDETTLSNITFVGLLAVPYSYTVITSKVIDIYSDSSLTIGESYTITVPVTVKDTDGRALSAQDTYTFIRAEVLPLAIESVTPTDESIDIDIGSDIVVTFNKAIDPDTVSIDTIWLEEAVVLVDDFFGFFGIVEDV